MVSFAQKCVYNKSGPFVLSSSSYYRPLSEAATPYSSRWTTRISGNGKYWSITEGETRKSTQSCIDRPVSKADKGHSSLYRNIEELCNGTFRLLGHSI